MDWLLYGIAYLLFLIGFGLNCVGMLGSPVVFLGALVAAWAGGFAVLGWGQLAVFAALAALAEALEFAGGLVGARFFGVSKPAFRAALLGMLIGCVAMLFTFNPLWVFVGLVLGGLIGEYRQQRRWRPALKAAAGILLGKIGGIIAKCLLAAVIIAWVTIALLRAAR